MLICLAATLIGFQKPLTDFDKAVIKTATKRCGELYPESPCLSKLIKTGPNSFQVLCGEKVKK